jgi:hypothetical protein
LLLPVLPSGKANRSLATFFVNFPLTNTNIAVRTTGVMWLVSASLVWLLELVIFNWATEIIIAYRHAVTFEHRNLEFTQLSWQAAAGNSLADRTRSLELPMVGTLL